MTGSLGLLNSAKGKLDKFAPDTLAVSPIVVLIIGLAALIYLLWYVSKR